MGNRTYMDRFRGFRATSPLASSLTPREITFISARPHYYQVPEYILTPRIATQRSRSPPPVTITPVYVTTANVKRSVSINVPGLRKK
jgi:hypothetical protein